MNDRIDFEKIKQTVLPYFIKIYGEEYTDIIMERMNQLHPIWYCTAEMKRSKLNAQKAMKNIELTFRFLDEHHIEIPPEIRSEIISKNKFYPITKVPDVQKILEAYFGNYEYNRNPFRGLKNITRETTTDSFTIKNNVKALNKIGIMVPVEKYNEWIETEEAKQVFEIFSQWNKSVEILDTEYDQFHSQFAEVEKYLDKCTLVKNEINEKYMIEFLCSIKNYMSESDRDLLEEYQMSEPKDWYSFQRKMKILKVVGNSFHDDGLITSFGIQMDETLSDPDTFDFNRNDIIEKRIEYYKLIGIYDEQIAPEEFLNSELAKSNMLKQEYIDDILAKKDQFMKDSEDEYIMITSTYQENLKEINSLGLVTKIDFNPSLIKNEVNAIIPQTRIINGKPQQAPLLLFSTENVLSEYIDVRLIHEMNHAVELALLECKDDKVLYKCGFEVFDDDDNQFGDYTQFSEIINQIIAMEITEAMHQDGIYLFDNPATSKVEGGTSYEQQYIFIEAFWKQFRKEIMASRVDHNLDILFEKVGRENFEILNECINEYTKLPYYKMMDDVRASLTTPLTQKREELIKRAHEVFEHMVEYANQVQNIESVEGMHM